MKIIDILKNKKTFSFEIFPPKTETILESAKSLTKELSKANPNFISVTYGAGGSTKRDTPSIVNFIENSLNITALCHFTCIGSEKEEIDSVLKELKTYGIKNILALRGDMPQNYNGKSYFNHANELAEYIKKSYDFCLGGACYPEKHPESKTLDEDIDNLKRKVDSGVDFLTTQLFFDNKVFYDFLNKIKTKGINIPILPGIMPITSAKQIKRICELSGNDMPKRFVKITEKFACDNKSMETAGIVYAAEQIIDLAANGIENIHLYTMNKPETSTKIRNLVSSII